MSTRRDFIKTSGALVVGFSLGDALAAQGPPSAPGGPARSLDLKQVDTWLAIHPDNTATVYIGFAELGQGASTALLQVAGEELDLDMSQLTTVPLDTTVTPNQGGTYSSASINRGSPQIRAAAAEARRALLQLASQRLGAPTDRLAVARGVITVAGQPQPSVTYGELIGGRRFDLEVSGAAPVKSPREYRLVGSSPARTDLTDKVGGRHAYTQHARLPGMLHGRVVRPRGQAAFGVTPRVVSVDEASVRGIPCRILRRGSFVGVVAEREWDAVRAARDLKVTWDIAPTLPGNAALFTRMRSEQTQDRVVLDRGDVGAALAGAPHVVSQIVRGPYQAHAALGPNCAVADVRPDSALVISPTQDIYGTRTVLAGVLGLPAERIQVRYQEGASNYGHGTQDDVTEAAAILSQLAGRPVRVQFMRSDEHGWDNYGRAHLGDVRAAADAAGRIVAYEYQGWQHNWMNVEPSAQLAGTAPAERDGSLGVSPLNLGSMYDVANLRLVNHRVNGMGYLRGAWLRSPLDLSFSFASEQAVDQLAFLTKADPWQFRQRNIKDPRWLGVLDAVARAAKWQPRPAAAARSRSRVVTGRGIAVGTHLASYGGAVAELEVDTRTGRVRITHLYGAIDAGLAVNPGNIENQIGGQLIQTASRMLKEEVLFNTSGVTSLDWNSYPILRFSEAPAVTAIVVQRLEERSTGAGEEVMAAAAAAVANAFFDATGVRLEEYPLTPARVLAALAG
ncbi:MAG: xanthine dehydrogenase family protein molybdopterin-binding subunit [Acidimicrobiia bacterium]|nr:xanthine dehydrogenase family protein molybdopterin-binding subunit [Acidimicrobiia bacterium]